MSLCSLLNMATIVLCLVCAKRLKARCYQKEKTKLVSGRTPVRGTFLLTFYDTSCSSAYTSVGISSFSPIRVSSGSSLLAQSIPLSHPARCQPAVRDFSLLLLYCTVSLPWPLGCCPVVLCTFTQVSWPSALSTSAGHTCHRGPGCPVLGQAPKRPSCLFLLEPCTSLGLMT